MKDWPTLYKAVTGGQKVQQWRIWVEEGPNGEGVIYTEYGLVGGKLQVQRDVVKEGKNRDKRNETTALEQARSEAESAWRTQKDRKGYGLDAAANESAAKRAAAPMLAQDYGKHVAKVHWDSAFGQPKLDGFRCIGRKTAGGVFLVSREGKPIITMGHIVATLNDILGDGDVFDGELYAHDLTFQQIASAVKREQDLSAKIQYHVYDSPKDLPFGERYEFLEDLLGLGEGGVRPVKTKKIKTADQLAEFHADCLADGYEGAMLRHGDAAYEAGRRSKHLLKVKTTRDADFAIIGVREGRGTHAGMAIFVLKTAEGVEFECTAPGSHDEKRAHWEQGAQRIGQKLTVKYQEMTTGESPVPRFPVAVRLTEEL